MRIVEITSQIRRDFTAVYECESCGAQHTSSGYDDSYFHTNVIPNMECKSCGAKAPSEYEPRGAKYADSQIV